MSKTSKQKKNLKSVLRNPYARLACILIFIIVVIALVLFAFFYAKKLFFSENPHFTLKNISVSANGYWNNRVSELSKIVKLEINQTNLFAISLTEIRNKLLKEKEYGIANVEISRVLPDTLNFKIQEEIPCAVLYNSNSSLVITDKSILINRKYTGELGENLPVVTGFNLKNAVDIPQTFTNQKSLYGKEVSILTPAVALIRMVDIDFPEFRIQRINIAVENQLSVYMDAPDGDGTVNVILPFTYTPDAPASRQTFNRNALILKKKMNELLELYQYLRWKRKKCSEINMLFADQAIVK